MFCGEFWIPSFPCFGLKSKSTVYNLAIFHLLHFPSIFQVIPTSEMMKRKFLHTISLLRLLFSRQVVSSAFVTTWTVAHQASQSMGFPGRNTGVGGPLLLQGSFPTQRSNLCLLHWQVDALPLSHQGSATLLRYWVACSHFHLESLSSCLILILSFIPAPALGQDIQKLKRTFPGISLVLFCKLKV